MTLKIYNSLTKKKDFKVEEKSKIKMYVCGPTVYDEPHIGHLRSAYIFEVVRNYLAFCECDVEFVRNVTDIDDKIIQRAKKLKRTTESVAKEYYDLYKAELKKLHITRPEQEPFATKHIETMKDMIRKLLEKGVAYEKGGDVYFEVNSFAEYGKLSGQKKEALLEGVRIDPNEKKKNPLDFALWKKSEEDEPGWDSDWGRGRPGWHIECSAMSQKCLKAETIDIHGGGRDLIFPHHENEIAQSEAATGKQFAKCWMHHGLVTVNNQKMSKSLNNYITLAQCKGELDINVLKFLFLGTHYRSPLDYSEENIKMEYGTWKRFHYFFDEAERYRKDAKPVKDKKVDEFETSFKKAMNDDFNTPQAFSELHGMMHYARKAENPSTVLYAAEKIEIIMTRIFRLSSFEATSVVGTQRITQKIKEREEAKQKKDFKTADRIRDELLRDGGIELIDLADGRTEWRKKIE